MTLPVYLDYAATTPVDPAVAQAMMRCLTAADAFGNPSSMHAAGRAAAALIDAARAQVAALVGAATQEVVFTSGATESNNLALLGIARANADRGRHVVTSRIEHKSVLDVCRRLEKEGFRITRLAPDAAGRIDPEDVRAALRPDTILVSVMQVSNEIGVIQDIAAIGRACREAGIAFHTDAAQSAGRIAIDVTHVPVDFMSLTAHKIYGPKGIGALYVRRAARALLGPQMFGGGQEQGLRPGTLPTHQIVGFGAAAALAARELARGAEFPRATSEAARITALRDRMWDGIADLGGVHLNGAAACRVPHILNVSFEGIEGESLITALGALALSTGSACSSASGEPSYVLRALGRGTRLAESSLRLSFGRFTTEAQIEHAVAEVRRQVRRLRAVSPRPTSGCPGGAGGRSMGDAVPAEHVEPAGAAQSAEVSVRRGSEEGCPAGGAALDSSAAGLIMVGADGFSPEVARLFLELPYAGRIPVGAARERGMVRSGEAGGPDEEVWVRFHLLMDGDIVKDARFEARGCPHTLAVAAWLASRLPGRRRAEGVPDGPQTWARALGVPAEKLGRLLAIEDALIAGLGLPQTDPGFELSEADRK